jgi:hypothetical protein
MALPQRAIWSTCYDSLRVIVAGLREYDDNNDGETVQDQARLISVMTVR